MSRSDANRQEGRPFIERLCLRFPWPLQAMMGLVSRLTPGSALRRMLLAEAFRRAFRAVSRMDTEVPLLFFEPDCETRFIGAFMPGMAERYHGHDGYREWAREWFEQWEEQQLEPVALIDRGERLIVRLHVVARGSTSDVEVVQDIGYIYRLSPRGRVGQLDMYWDWPKALEAAELRG